MTSRRHLRGAEFVFDRKPETLGTRGLFLVSVPNCLAGSASLRARDVGAFPPGNRVRVLVFVQRQSEQVQDFVVSSRVRSSSQIEDRPESSDENALVQIKIFDAYVERKHATEWLTVAVGLTCDSLTTMSLRRGENGELSLFDMPGDSLFDVYGLADVDNDVIVDEQVDETSAFGSSRKRNFSALRDEAVRKLHAATSSSARYSSSIETPRTCATTGIREPVGADFPFSQWDTAVSPTPHRAASWL